MSHSQQLYHTVFRRLRGGLPAQRITHVRNLSLLVTALYLVSSCALSRVAAHLVVRGRKQAGPAHCVAYWAIGETEPWYLLTDQLSSLQALHVYRRRFGTEPMYRDVKSSGWHLEASRLREPKRLERLLLGIALAYVWLMQLASRTITRGHRRLVDRTARRTLRYFRIGWNWLLWQLDHGYSIDLPDLLYV